MAKRPAAPSNSPNLEELFNMGVDAAKKGQRQGARVIFRQILESDKRNIRAMMYLAKLAPSDKERMGWINRILEIRPGYEPAEELLNKITYGKAAGRNRVLFRVGIGVYMAVIILVAALMMISAASLTVL